MDIFEKHIKAYLDERAANDPMFAKSYANENKNIEECCRYLIAEAYDRCKSNISIMDDETAYSLAIHYYDEDKIEIKGLPRGVKLMTSAPNNGATYKPTKKDKEEARNKAMKLLEEEAYKELRQRNKKNRMTAGGQQEGTQASELTLFDML